MEDKARALVLGASGAIGGAIAERLDGDPRYGTVVTLSRRGDGFEITDEASVAAAAERLRKAYGTFDLIFNATGALTIDGVGPEKTIRVIDAAVMSRQFLVNAIGPALLLKHFHALLPCDRRSVFATLSARVGSISDNRLGGWISYRASKAAQNQIVRTAALEIARTHPLAVVAALHPGTVETPLSAPFSKGHDTMPPTLAAERLLAVTDRLQPVETGGFFAYDGSVIGW